MYFLMIMLFYCSIILAIISCAITVGLIFV